MEFVGFTLKVHVYVSLVENKYISLAVSLLDSVFSGVYRPLILSYDTL